MATNIPNNICVLYGILGYFGIVIYGLIGFCYSILIGNIFTLLMLIAIVIISLYFNEKGEN